MSDRVRNAGEVGAGAGVLGASLAVSPLENRYNSRLRRRHGQAVSRLQGAYGLDRKGQLVLTNPWGPGAPRRQKEQAKELVRRKHTAISELNRKVKLKEIPMAHRTGRGWAGAAIAAPLIWHGARSSVDKKVTRRDVDAGAAGAVAAGGGYHAAHYAVMPLDRRNERKIADDDRLRGKARAYRNASDLPRNAKLGDPRWLPYFRNYPTDLPGGRMKRVFSNTHAGTRGGLVATAVALGGGAAAVGARRRKVAKAGGLGRGSLKAAGNAAGASALRGHFVRTGRPELAARAGRVQRLATRRSVDLERVGKSLYEGETKTSLPRAVGATTGTALLAWGVPRHRMLGPALARGVKAATRHESEAALEALRLAEQAAGTLRDVTARGERKLRTINRVNDAIDRVPRAIRPEVATAAGLLLVGHSHPVRQKRYTPVLVQRPIVRGT